MTIKDKDGQPFDGGSTYRLTVPANAPVKQYWSATVYDRATHALIREQTRVSRSSQRAGTPERTPTVRWTSTSVPKRPPARRRNWVPTNADGQFEVLFRFYGPEKPLFDKTWKLPDVAERRDQDRP